MRIISLDELLIPEDRQRKHFAEKPLADLRASILSKGLMHPPVAQVVDGEYILVAGERRTRAICGIADLGLEFNCDGKVIPAGSIPIILITDLAPIDIREAELEENVIRENLTWQEQANAIAELHSLRGEQAVAQGSTQSAKATATEIKGTGEAAVGSEISRVTEAVILSRHLDDPDVAKAKSTKEALKIVRKKAEAAHREVLAQQFDQSSTPHQLIKGDSLTLLPGVPDGSIDLIITDPPYGVGADTFGDMAGTGHSYKDTPEYALQCYSTLAVEGYRATKSNAVAYVFCDIRYWQKIEMEFILAGWESWPQPLIWNKTNGMLPRPEVGPRKTYEAILMFMKGSPRFYKTGAPDVLTIPQREELSHGAQKPIDLYIELIARSALPGARILDPFAGSGTVFPAATRTKCVAVGFEISPEYYNIALTRMSQTDTFTLEELGL